MVLGRIKDTEFGTFGILFSEGIPFALTLENTWLNNVRNVSCIPIGKYVCKRFNSTKFGNTFQILGVPKRGNGEAIIFHKGNLDDDTRGCILIGEQFELLNGEPAILRSGKGFAEFMEKNKHVNEFDLIIRDMK
jgi:hypothetical protein